MKNMEIYVNVHAKHLIPELGRLRCSPGEACTLAVTPKESRTRFFARFCCGGETNAAEMPQDVPVLLSQVQVSF